MFVDLSEFGWHAKTEWDLLQEAAIRADPRCVIWAGTVRPQVARLRSVTKAMERDFVALAMRLNPGPGCRSPLWDRIDHFWSTNSGTKS